jgi:hypothetical protein
MNTSRLNNTIYRIANSNDREKMASLAIDLGTFVRDKLREVSIIDKVLPPSYVTHADVQREEDTSTYSMIVDIEPDSEAAVVNLSGQKGARYVKGQRFKIPFTKIDTDEETINVTELPAFTYPVTKVIEDNQVRDIQIAKDVRAFRAIDDIVAASGKEIGIPVGDGTLDKLNTVKLKNLIDVDRLSTDRLVMNIVDFNDLMGLDHTTLGNDLASQVFVDGYVFTTFMGMKIIVTTNPEVVFPGVVYAFTSPDFLGKQFVIQDTQFSIEKRHDVLSWKMWQVLGMGFINTKSVARIDLEASWQRFGADPYP